MLGPLLILGGIVISLVVYLFTSTANQNVMSPYHDKTPHLHL